MAASYEVYLKHPFTMIVAGPTGCGKTQWTLGKLCAHVKTVCNIPPVRVTYFYGSRWQPLFSQYRHLVNFVAGAPSEDNDEIRNVTGLPTWIIIDDLMNDVTDSKQISDLFTKGSHHNNVSVILLVQNLFAKGKLFRTMSLNTHYFVLFKNPRDRATILHIARQVFPNNVKFLGEAYNDATGNSPFSYLFIDLKATTAEKVRVLTNIFKENGPYVIAYST